MSIKHWDLKACSLPTCSHGTSAHCKCISLYQPESPAHAHAFELLAQCIQSNQYISCCAELYTSLKSCSSTPDELQQCLRQAIQASHSNTAVQPSAPDTKKILDSTTKVTAKHFRLSVSLILLLPSLPCYHEIPCVQNCASFGLILFNYSIYHSRSFSSTVY